MSLCLRDTFGNTFYTSRWLHDGFTTSSSLRIPFASTSYAKLSRRVSFVTALGIIVCPSFVHRVPIGRLRTCFGSTLAFYQIRDENRAKLKISYSCQNRLGMTPPLRNYEHLSKPSIYLDSGPASSARSEVRHGVCVFVLTL